MGKYEVTHTSTCVISANGCEVVCTSELWRLASAIVGVTEAREDSSHIVRGVKHMRDIANITIHEAKYLIKAAYEDTEYTMSHRHYCEISKRSGLQTLVTVPTSTWDTALAFANLAHREGIESKALWHTARLLGHVAEIPSYDAYDVMQAAYERTTTLPF